MLIGIKFSVTVCWYLVYSSASKKEKKFFLFFTLTPSHMWLKRPVYRGFKGEGKCEGKFLPSHLHSLTLPARAGAIRCRRFEAIVNERYDFFDKEKILE